MEIVGEAVLSVSLELLFNRLASSDLLKFARQEQLLTELKKWEKKLLEIQEVLDDAEGKQISKRSVKAWLVDLRDLAYDVEDVLDEFGYEVMRRKVMEEGDDDHLHQSSTSKVRKFFPTCCSTSNFGPAYLMRNVEMGSKIKEISGRLEEISARKAELGLDKVAAISVSAPARERPITTTLVHQPLVRGRDADKRAVIDMLLKDEPVIERNFCVVSIVAMGGMGKTTLARLVYDDSETANHFDIKAWACVSDQFDAVRITKDILGSVTSHTTDSRDFNFLQERLREQLKGKRFLLVLDDIWTDKIDDWDSLRSPFWSGAPGSKIIVTTRSKNVALMMGGAQNLYDLKHLSEADCLAVFEKYAFENRDITDHPGLASLAEEIVKKCGGLPLAAKALGGLLRYEQNENRWRSILTSKIWDLPADKCSILPALRLSYDHLPSHLKRCFAYCAIFPKDYGFDEKELVLLWMAEGLIQHSEDEKLQMEDLGEGYFQELLCRSFFQPSSNNDLQFVMHDLINDLARSVAGEICYSLEENLERNRQQQDNLQKVRYSSFIPSRYDLFQKFEAFHKMKHLRTFIVLPIGPIYFGNYLSNKVLTKLMPKLRVLSLSGYAISEIPNSIGDLKHLRYLNLSLTQITRLPDSIGNLYNLQTLILSCCRSLTRLPTSIGSLINLRYLDIAHTRLEEMPSQIGKLKKLQVLSNFIVGKGNALQIKELKDMTDLKGKLCISKLENVVNIEDAKDVGLNKKHGLEELSIMWSDDSGTGQMNVLESLQPHSGLNKLRIQSYGGLEFPPWMRDASFSEMVNLSLIGCKKCTSLPCLGQLPLLKCLFIEEMNGVKAIGAEFYGGDICSPNSCFRSLKILDLRKMPQWEQWEDWSSPKKSSFPRLCELLIWNCPKLIKKLPTYLPSLTTLSILGCPKLESPLERLPSLGEMEVRECNEVVLRSGIEFTSLTQLKIEGIFGLIRLHGGFMSFLHGLRVLEIEGCKELKYLWENGFGLENVEKLCIRCCDQLERLPDGWQRLACLGELEIRNCPKLVSFPEMGFPPMLTSLQIYHCEGLKCLPDGMMLMRDNICVLEELIVCNCSSLICFPEGQLPTTLKILHIWNCKNIESLPQGIKGCSLECLMIECCPSLVGFPEGDLPSTLKKLIITKCEKLESLPEGIMHYTAALQDLYIVGCSSLTSFPRGKFPSTLNHLDITDCAQLESISEEMFHCHNPSLESLNLWKYPKFKTLPDYLHNLRYLEICDCENLVLLPHQFQNFSCLETLSIKDFANIKTPLSQWGLSRLTSLKRLTIDDIFPEATSFYDDHCLSLIPSTLTHLSIERFQNLESLASLSLQTLTSLDMLFINDCPKLQSFLPREGLPDMLSQLCIRNCPLLNERCSKKRGLDWPNIAYIPCVEIDGQSNFEQ